MILEIDEEERNWLCVICLKTLNVSENLFTNEYSILEANKAKSLYDKLKELE